MARRYALVIGVGENYKVFGSLPAAVADAKAMATLLKKQGQFDVELVTDLVDQARLVKAFNKFLEQAAGGEALIYYSGHGFPLRNVFGQTDVFLALSDCEVEMADGYAQKEFNGWPLSGFNQRLAKAEFSSLVMLLDCCHSGFLLEKQALQQTFALFKDKDYGLLTACRKLEQAWIEAEAVHSLFTHQVLAGLGETQADERGVVSVARLTAYVQEKLKQAGQEPVVFNMGRELAIVDYRCYAPEPKASEECPYQGLNAFTPETRQFFFGREAEVATILRKLDESNFVAVVGPSGIGKSSVVRAGLVPRLEERGWTVLGPMKPGPKPMAELERLFQGVFPERELSNIYELVEAGQLVEVVQQLSEQLERQKQTGQHFLLVIDQFEEVFTLTKQVERGDSEAEQEAARQAQLETQRRFIEPLLAVGALVGSPLAIVVTMRSDFVDAWLATGQPTAVVQEQAVYVGPLQGAELKAAIQGPAQHETRKYDFDPGLLPLILEDVKTEQHSLPLLEFALTQLWEKRDKEARLLTAVAYLKMGRLQGGLNSHADEIYGLLQPSEQDWARRIFLALVRISKDGRDMRQRRERSALLAMGSSEREREDIEAVIRALSGTGGRLLVADGAEVDLTHEALMRGWQKFVEWRQGDRDQLRLRQRAEDAWEEWKERNRSDSYLMARGLLEELRELGSAERDELLGSADLGEFLRLSDAAEQESAAQLKKALAIAKLREEQTRALNLPKTRILDQSLLAIDLVGKSLEQFGEPPVVPAEDLLKQAWDKIRERLRCEGHSDWLNSVAFSPQGDRIVSGSSDNTLRLWDLEGNQIGPPFEGHSDWVRSVAFSPKGDRIISGSSDNTLRLWDLEGNQIGNPFEGHSGLVRSIAFSPKGDRIVSGSSDNTLRLWDLEGNQIGNSFECHSDWVRSVAFSPKGDRIISGSSDNTLCLWDLKGNQLGNPFEGHSGPVRSVAFSPKGDCIVSGSSDNTLRLWDLEGNQIGPPFEGHSGQVWSVAFSPKGDRIASGSDDNTLCLWDLEGNQIGHPFEGHSGSVLSVAFSPGGDSIVSGSSNNILRLWDLEGNQLGNPFEGHYGQVWSVAFSPKGDRIASGSDDNTLRLWDLEGNQIGTPFEGHSGLVLSVAFNPKGDRIVSSGEDNTIRLWNPEGNQIGNPFEGHSDWVNSVAFSTRGDRIVSGSSDNTVRLWDLEGNQISTPFEGHSDWVNSVAFSPGGDRIVSGSSDNTLRLWDLEGNQIGPPFEGHSGLVWSAAFSSKGDRIVSSSDDNTLRFWDLEGNQLGPPFEGHSGSVLSVAFSPKGDRIVSGSSDNTLRLWDLEGNQLGNPLEGHSGRVWSVAFSPGGDRIVSGSSDSTLRLWRGGTWQDWLRGCCNQLMYHSSLVAPQTEYAQRACQVCMERVWTKAEQARFHRAQGYHLRREGDAVAAQAKFEQALEKDPTIEIDG